MKLSPRQYAAAYLDLAEQVPSKQLADLAQAFWSMVLKQRRFAWRERIIFEAQSLARERAGQTLIEVQTARETSPDLRRLVEKGLATSLGKGVEIHYGVKPHLLAGIVVKVGDNRYDASLKGRLDALERTLAGESSA